MPERCANACQPQIYLISQPRRRTSGHFVGGLVGRFRCALGVPVKSVWFFWRCRGEIECAVADGEDQSLLKALLIRLDNSLPFSVESPAGHVLLTARRRGSGLYSESSHFRLPESLSSFTQHNASDSKLSASGLLLEDRILAMEPFSHFPGDAVNTWPVYSLDASGENNTRQCQSMRVTPCYSNTSDE